MSKKGFPTFTAYSAGSHPQGTVNPEALHQIELAKLPTSGLRSKDWREFAKPGAPAMDFIFTVCADMVRRVRFVPGDPMTTNWGVPDPVAVGGPPEKIGESVPRSFCRPRP